MKKFWIRNAQPVFREQFYEDYSTNPFFSAGKLSTVRRQISRASVTADFPLLWMIVEQNFLMMTMLSF